MPTTRRNGPLSPAEMWEIFQALEDGASHAQVAERFRERGRDRSTVNRTYGIAEELRLRDAHPNQTSLGPLDAAEVAHHVGYGASPQFVRKVASAWTAWRARPPAASRTAVSLTAAVPPAELQRHLDTLAALSEELAAGLDVPTLRRVFSTLGDCLDTGRPLTLAATPLQARNARDLECLARHLQGAALLTEMGAWETRRTDHVRRAEHAFQVAAARASRPPGPALVTSGSQRRGLTPWFVVSALHAALGDLEGNSVLVDSPYRSSQVDPERLEFHSWTIARLANRRHRGVERRHRTFVHDLANQSDLTALTAESRVLESDRNHLRAELRSDALRMTLARGHCARCSVL